LDTQLQLIHLPPSSFKIFVKCLVQEYALLTSAAKAMTLIQHLFSAPLLVLLDDTSLAGTLTLSQLQAQDKIKEGDLKTLPVSLKGTSLDILRDIRKDLTNALSDRSTASKVFEASKEQKTFESQDLLRHLRQLRQKLTGYSYAHQQEEWGQEFMQLAERMSHMRAMEHHYAQPM